MKFKAKNKNGMILSSIVSIATFKLYTMNQHKSILVSVFLTVLFTFLFINSKGQFDKVDSSISSEYGWTISPHDTLRMLMVFVQFEYDLNPDIKAKEHWEKDKFPSNIHNILEPFASTNPEAEITKYFHTMSLGNYHVLGDYIDEVITIKESEIPGFYTRFNKPEMRRLICEKVSSMPEFMTHNSLAMEDFDLWNNSNGTGTKKIKGPDSPHSFDHVIFFLRNFAGAGSQGGQASGASPGKIFGYNADSYSMQYGVIPRTIYHEYGHLLIGGNNFHAMGGQHNGGGYNYVIPIQSGWGMMGTSVFDCLNGWERYRFGWKNKQSDNLINAKNLENQDVNGDLTATPENEGIYILRDYITSGDAIRIKLPNLNPKKEWEQWIWLENHQTISKNGVSFDQFLYQDRECVENAKPGLWAYVQIDKNQKYGRKTFQGYGDYLKVLPANGFYDFTWEDTLVKNNCVNWSSHNPYLLDKINQNPLTGNSELERPVADMGSGKAGSDGKPDGRIRMDEKRLPFIKKVDGQLTRNLNYHGRPEHAFSLNGNKKLGIGTNPSTASHLTHVSFDRKKSNEKNNQKVLLNGISIELLDEMEDGSIKIQIDFNDVSVDENVIWRADTIVLPKIEGKKGYSLDLKRKKELIIMRGKTPTRTEYPDTINGKYVFTMPTTFIVEEGATINLGRRSLFALAEGSILIMKPGSKILRKSRAWIALRDNSKIYLDSEDQIQNRFFGMMSIDKNNGAGIYVKGEKVK